eukprot:2476565-Prymnesium_polylepis.3
MCTRAGFYVQDVKPQTAVGLWLDGSPYSKPLGRTAAPAGCKMFVRVGCRNDRESRTHDDEPPGGLPRGWRRHAGARDHADGRPPWLRSSDTGTRTVHARSDQRARERPTPHRRSAAAGCGLALFALALPLRQ